MRKVKSLFIFLLSISMMTLGFLPSFAEGQNGTTLSANVDATWTWTQEYAWSIDKSASPSDWNLFQGDTGTSLYTIAVTKGESIEEKYLKGSVSVTNGGAVPTEGLSIVVKLTKPPSATALSTEVVDLGSNTILAPGESHSYDFMIDYPGAMAGADYKVTADVTITNHSGHLSTAFGPSPSYTAAVPASCTIVNNAVTVDDTEGFSCIFTNSGLAGYFKTFTCADEGINENTAIIRETGDSASASVTVNCFALDISKDANTSYTKRYLWTIDKEADKSEVTLAKNECISVNYTVSVDADAVDEDFAAAGKITIHNPAPISAVINNISDIVTPDIVGTITTPIEFPYTIASGETLILDYTVDLPDAAERTNTAAVTIQNYAYPFAGEPEAQGTTTFSGSAAVDFNNADITEVDKTAAITDDQFGALGSVSWGDELPALFQYSMNAGPYTVCGDYSFNNLASLITNDTGIEARDNWNLLIHVPCQGATLTIGYWKTHAGFGPQNDMVSDLLPIWLGTPGGGKSVEVTTTAGAVKLLGMNGDASNGINKLYAQLLAAKLNIVNGADDTAVKSTIASTDSFLAANDESSWSKLSKADKTKVLNWMTTLDNYNNGIIGPGHATT